MKKIATLFAVLLLFVFVSPAFSRGGSSGFSSGSRSSFSSSRSFSSSPSRSFSSPSKASPWSASSTRGPSAIRPSQASPIKPSSASSIKPSQASPIRPSAVAPRSAAPRVYSYPTRSYPTSTTVINKTYVTPVRPSYVYYREPSSGFGNFWFNMWIYQTWFNNDHRPQWNEQNGPRPVVKVKDPEKGEDYEISNYAPPRAKMRFWDYAFIGLLVGAVGGIGYGIYRLIKRRSARSL